jgi:hypothetical protein
MMASYICSRKSVLLERKHESWKAVQLAVIPVRRSESDAGRGEIQPRLFPG